MIFVKKLLVSMFFIYFIFNNFLDNVCYVCEEYYVFFKFLNIKFVCLLNLIFFYILGYFFYICFEFFKNFLCVVVEWYGVDNDDEYFLIKVIVVEGREDIMIKIFDEGGGILRSVILYIWM